MARVTLISVDGIPGSGKSTTARWLSEILNQKGLRVLLVDEDNPRHPLRYLTDLQKPLAPWDEVSTKTFSRNCLKKISQFLTHQVTNDAQGDIVIVVDGLLYHTDTTSFFLMQPTEPELKNHFKQMIQIVNHVRFLPLFLYHHPFGSSLSATINNRPQEWTDMQVAWKTSSPYCKKAGYCDQTGYLEFYQKYEEWITNHFRKISDQYQNCLLINNPQHDWLVTRRKIWDYYCEKLLCPSHIKKLF